MIFLQAESVLGALNNSQLDLSIHETLGLMNYTVTPWEHVEEKIGAHRRQASYSLNRQISQFGTKVTCVQQQTVSDDLKKLVTNEILTLHDVPFGEYFEVFVLNASYVGFSIKDKKKWFKCPGTRGDHIH